MLNTDSWILAFTDSAVMTNIQKPKADIQFYFVISYSTSQFPILRRFLLYLKMEISSRIKQIPINDPLDEFNFLFLIPFLARAPFLDFLVT